MTNEKNGAVAVGGTANIPRVSVGKLVRLLSDAYVGLIRAEMPLKNFPSVMLWSSPGIGKSQSVRKIAETIGQRTGKRTVVTDVRLLLFNPIDLRGIPTANEDKTFAVWLKPQIFRMDAGKDAVNILFLDEITAAPPSVQAAAYQITLDRTVGEHKLPDNCIVIAAGNRVTDRSVAYKMPKPLSNRMMHFAVESNFESWRAWAVEKGIHPMVTGFLSFRRDRLNLFDPASEDLAFATPRSWEMVSDVLRYVSEDINVAGPMIEGLVGCGVAAELKTWTKVYSILPSVDDILGGKNPDVPKGTDALYALTAAIICAMKENAADERKLKNAVVYANRLPADFSIVLLRDCLSDEKLKERLRNIPEFMKWVEKKGALLNGLV